MRYYSKDQCCIAVIESRYNFSEEVCFCAILAFLEKMSNLPE